MHWFCRRLTLSLSQQRELHFLKRSFLQKEFDELTESRDHVRIKLGVAHRALGSRYATSDPKATINRRLEIWFAGRLSDWKPQRTADLYNAITGGTMTRQLAGNIINQVRRDLPKSDLTQTRNTDEA